MSKTFLVTSTDLMMVQFLVPHIKELNGEGYSIDVACSNVGNRIDEVRQLLSPYIRNFFELRLRRNPFSPKNYLGYKDLRSIFNRYTYDFVWTNEPVMGVATRLAARSIRKNGCKVLYMAHGFHFFNGAPKLNWILYYPIEKFFARFTDVICTINNEDYARAKTFKIPSVNYIHGVGMNPERILFKEKMKDIRKELKLRDSDLIVLSVGELNRNKNHRTVIKALAVLNNPRIHYIICGIGAEEKSLRNIAEKEGISSNLHLLGYRQDVLSICSCADIYVMPSYREGLGVAALEAMYCGLPLITSNIRGLSDLNKDGVNGFLCTPSDFKGFAAKIKYLLENPQVREELGRRNRKDVLPFTLDNTKNEVKSIIDSL